MRIIKNLEAIFLELTAAASWLNTAFAGYDRLILSALHAVSNSFFTFLAKLITLIGEKGLVFFLVAIIFMLFPKTRKLGVCIFGAVCCGALITNVILKDAIARPRPLTVAPYSQWWADINAPAEDGWSFPSGHVTAAAAGMVAIRLMKGKKWTVPAVVWVLLMMISRNYLMAHYPTDVLAAAIIGTASGFISYYITRFIFQFLYINRKKSWCGLVLNWSAPDYKGIPSKLGLTGEPVNDYFAKTFEGKTDSDRSAKDTSGKKFDFSALKGKASAVLKKVPIGKTSEPVAESAAEVLNAEPAESSVPTEEVQSDSFVAQQEEVPSEAAPAENDAAEPVSQPEPVAKAEQTEQTARRSHLSTGKLPFKSKTSASSGYQGKHVK